MAHKVKFRLGSPTGQVLGQLGPFTTQKLALKQAHALADLGYIEDGILVTVEEVGGKRKNPSSRSYKGHKIKGKTGKYTVEPYGYEFPNLKSAKGWLDKHVRDAYPAPKKATKRRKNTRKNPSNYSVKKVGRGYVAIGPSYWGYNLAILVPAQGGGVGERRYSKDEMRRYIGTKAQAEALIRGHQLTHKGGSREPNPHAPWITREGKLGGPGYTKRTAKARHALLNKCVKGYGYRSCLGSLQVLLLNSEMGNTARKVILTDKNWLEKKYGGPGSFGPRKKNTKPARRPLNGMSVYHYYVVDKTSNKILSGWDYKEDAKDDVVDIKEFHPRKKIGIYAQKSVERMGIDVIDPFSWSNR